MSFGALRFPDQIWASPIRLSQIGLILNTTVLAFFLQMPLFQYICQKEPPSIVETEVKSYVR